MNSRASLAAQLAERCDEWGANQIQVLVIELLEEIRDELREIKKLLGGDDGTGTDSKRV
jgi:hypothetical protein